MRCPYCSNEDPRMMELLAVLSYVYPVVYKYLCSCCSKEFVSEVYDETVPKAR